VGNVFYRGKMNYLELIDISVKFNNHHVLDKISFTVKEGEILAVIGPSGCGKTTLLNVISGFVKPFHGDVLMHSNSIKREYVLICFKRIGCCLGVL
jgi:ABC-type Fe3+/spermidine/putrescine transport system ATPase subunit